MTRSVEVTLLDAIGYGPPTWQPARTKKTVFGGAQIRFFGDGQRFRLRTGASVNRQLTEEVFCPPLLICINQRGRLRKSKVSFPSCYFLHLASYTHGRELQRPWRIYLPPSVLSGRQRDC